MSTLDTRRLRRLAQSSHEASLATSQTTTFETRSIPMTQNLINPTAGASNTGAWLSFTYAQFGAAALMAGLGIWFLPVDIIVKGYMMMANVFLVGSAFTLAKTIRDEHEARRFANRLEEARTEKLLMEVGRAG